jgi:hypothetical protein
MVFFWGGEENKAKKKPLKHALYIGDLFLWTRLVDRRQKARYYRGAKRDAKPGGSLKTHFSIPCKLPGGLDICQFCQTMQKKCQSNQGG